MELKDLQRHVPASIEFRCPTCESHAVLVSIHDSSIFVLFSCELDVEIQNGKTVIVNCECKRG